MAKLNVVKEVEIKSLNLELSLPEVKTLCLICSSIGGSPTNSARKYIDNIAKELQGIFKISFEEMKKVKGSIDLPLDTLQLVENNENLLI